MNLTNKNDRLWDAMKEKCESRLIRQLSREGELKDSLQNATSHTKSFKHRKWAAFISLTEK